MMAGFQGDLQEGCDSQACEDIYQPYLRRNPCVAILGESEVDFVKELDGFLSQGVGAYPHMWVGFLIINEHLSGKRLGA